MHQEVNKILWQCEPDGCDNERLLGSSWRHLENKVKGNKKQGCGVDMKTDGLGEDMAEKMRLHWGISEQHVSASKWLAYTISLVAF